jgi:integrase
MNIPKIKYVFDRKHTAGSGRKGKIDLRITHNKVQKFVSTGIAVYPKEWNERKELVVNVGEAMELNNILISLKQKAFKIISDMMERDEIDINAIPKLLKARRVDISFLEYILTRAEKKAVSDYTKKAYHVFYSRFEAWGGMKYFSDVSEKGIRDFDEYLHKVRWTVTDRFGNEVEKGYSQASIGSMHKNLKAFINDAVVDGFIKENPYSARRIRIDKGGTRIDQFLTKEEIGRIESAGMPTRSLTEARDLFLLQCYSGLSYVDLMAYDFTQCRNAKDYAVFSGVRSKTGTIFTFVLTPKAKAILQRYDYVMPKLPNQKYNVKLKLIADAAGIDKNVTTHDARRSCGYMLLNAGVPIAVVSRVLGHSSVRQTEAAYARLLDDTIADEIKKHMK